MKVIALFALCTMPVLAERIELEMNPASTAVHWILGDVLHTVRGTFKLTTGKLWFDTENGKAGGQLIVDATSGESGSGARDGRMHKSVLESGRYPAIVFVPDGVEGKVVRLGDSQVQLHGLFTIHGGAHEVRMNVKVHLEQQRATAIASFTVPYVKWGMKDPSNFLLKPLKLTASFQW